MKAASIPMMPDDMRITDITKESAQFPGVCFDTAGYAMIHWQSYHKRRDTLRVARLTGDLPLVYEEISGPGQVLYPVSLYFEDAVWYAWSEYIDGKWNILVRCCAKQTWGDIVTVETGEALFYPCLFVFGDKLYLLWTRQGKGESTAVMCVLSGSESCRPETVSITCNAYRARACQGGDGNLYLVYDAYSNGTYQLLARIKTSIGWSDEIRVDEGDEWATRPCIMATPLGATVCWHSFGYGAAYGVYYSDLSKQSGILCSTPQQAITCGTGWYMNLATASNQKGLQVIAYTWDRKRVQVRFRRENGAWSRPSSVSWETKINALHPSLAVDKDDIITLAWQYVPTNGHFDRNAQIVVIRLTLEDLEQRFDSTIEETKNIFTVPISAEKQLSAQTPQIVAEWLACNGYGGKLLFGDIHGQSGISDGMGEVDQYYHRARAKANLDFVALTDHDCYPDWLSQSEWELIRTTNRLMNKDGELSCILAYEWTPNEYKYDFGHKNIYFRGDEGDVFRSGDALGMTPSDLFRSIKDYQALCIPHHPAADWEIVSAATDWDFHDAEVQRAVEIFSRHAPYENFEIQSKFTKNIKKMKRRCVQDGLARGYRLGFTAGSDSHQMEHGVEGGIMAVFSDSHTREAIWDSLFKRTTYGTTGARILLSLKVNGKPMGSELVIPKGEQTYIEISVLGTDKVNVELVKNNRTVKTWQPGTNVCATVWEDTDRSSSDFYYLRVTQQDEHMAWSSPVWVDEENYSR